MGQVLTCMGLGKRFLQFVNILYVGPTARARLNISYSDVGEINRGTKQGCPLSPLDFALAAEPIISLINGGHATRGLMHGCGAITISLYADYLILYVLKPDTNLAPVTD